MYLFLCLHLLIIADLLFSMLLSLCRALVSFPLRHRRHRLELWLYDLWVPKISQDLFEFLLADIVFQYSFDSSVSVWYLMQLNVFYGIECFLIEYCFANAIINFCFWIFFFWCDTSFI